MPRIARSRLVQTREQCDLEIVEADQRPDAARYSFAVGRGATPQVMIPQQEFMYAVAQAEMNGVGTERGQWSIRPAQQRGFLVFCIRHRDNVPVEGTLLIHDLLRAVIYVVNGVGDDPPYRRVAAST